MSTFVDRLRYSLRPGKESAPRNFFTAPAKKGKYTSIPFTTIGSYAHGVVGEYHYESEANFDNGPRLSAYAAPEMSKIPQAMPKPVFRVCSPGKRSSGSGSCFGLFSNVPHIDGQSLVRPNAGPCPVQRSWESTGQRMIAQNLYPIQVFHAGSQASLNC